MSGEVKRNDATNVKRTRRRRKNNIDETEDPLKHSQTVKNNRKGNLLDKFLFNDFDNYLYKKLLKLKYKIRHPFNKEAFLKYKHAKDLSRENKFF